MNIDRIRKENEAYRKANPWILQNMQNSQALSGRFPTRYEAEQEANRRGGVVAVEGHVVLFSEMPSL